jgi:nitrate reductase NapE component
MAQTKKKRRRKHRGTAAGNIERAGRTGKARTREDAKQIARQRRAEKLDRPPEWRSTINRAGIAAIVFAVLVVVLFGRPIVSGALLGAIMFGIYVPLGFATDSAIYRFRQRRKT